MVSSVCKRISCRLPALTPTHVGRLLVAGAVGLATFVKVASAGSLLASVPVAVLAAGATHYLFHKFVGKELPSIQVPLRLSSSALIQNHFDSKESHSPQLDRSALLLQPVGKAAMIQNEDHSCFCSAVLWPFLGNIPEVLKEIPEAIVRRLRQEILFPKGVNILFSAEQIEPIANILNLLRQNRPFCLQDFNALRKTLQKLEGAGFPQAGGAHWKELLSLLELHDLVREFQTTDKISGTRANVLRRIVNRVNPSFQDVGNRMGDAQEVVQILGTLIFSGSPLMRTFSSFRDEGNWGERFLPMPQKPNFSIDQLLCENLAGGQYDQPPSLFVLALNRWDPQTLQMDSAPVQANEEFRLSNKFFKNGMSPRYELVGVSRKFSDSAHYDAIWKRPIEQAWYYGDDRNTVCSFNPAQLGRIAESGYLFFYRLKR